MELVIARFVAHAILDGSSPGAFYQLPRSVMHTKLTFIAASLNFCLLSSHPVYMNWQYHRSVNKSQCTQANFQDKM